MRLNGFLPYAAALPLLGASVAADAADGSFGEQRGEFEHQRDRRIDLAADGIQTPSVTVKPVAAAAVTPLNIVPEGGSGNGSSNNTGFGGGGGGGNNVQTVTITEIENFTELLTQTQTLTLLQNFTQTQTLTELFTSTETATELFTSTETIRACNTGGASSSGLGNNTGSFSNTSNSSSGSSNTCFNCRCQCPPGSLPQNPAWMNQMGGMKKPPPPPPASSAPPPPANGDPVNINSASLQPTVTVSL